MTQDLKHELAEMVAPADWAWISPHANRGAVVVVDQSLDLAEVGVAIATDNVPVVDRWIAEALIVQPFVLVQDCTTDEN